jgi:hypothetical protein
MPEKSAVIIFCVIASRRRYLSILKIYLDELVLRGEVDQVHVWDYTKGTADAEYVAQMCSHPAYSLQQASDRESERNFYEFYTQWHNGSDDEEAVLIKCSDDILYIQMSALQRFATCCQKEQSLCFPEIINNGACEFLKKASSCDNAEAQNASAVWSQSIPNAVAAHEEFFRRLQNPSRIALQKGVSDNIFTSGADMIPWAHHCDCHFYGCSLRTARKYFSLLLRHKYSTEVQDNAPGDTVVQEDGLHPDMLVFARRRNRTAPARVLGQQGQLWAVEFTDGKQKLRARQDIHVSSSKRTLRKDRTVTTQTLAKSNSKDESFLTEEVHSLPKPTSHIFLPSAMCVSHFEYSQKNNELDKVNSGINRPRVTGVLFVGVSAPLSSTGTSRHRPLYVYQVSE